MTQTLPRLLIDSIADGSWKHVSADVLRRCLGSDLDDLELYTTLDRMLWMFATLDNAGFVDDPEFCMTREHHLESEDPRLVYPRALFIGASTVPGDDMFVAIQQEDCEEYDPPVLVLDWRKDVPARWTARGKLSELIHGIGAQSWMMKRIVGFTRYRVPVL